MLTAATTITSCSNQNNAHDAAAVTAQNDSIEARQMAKEETFLAQKAKEPGVQSLGGGLLYKVLRAGNGAQPTSTSMVTVDYEGKLIDGKQFDSSRRGSGAPAVFRVNELITGWQVALVNMHIGEKWEIYVPAEAGYGERGAGRDIPGHSTLIFQLELIDIN